MKNKRVLLISDTHGNEEAFNNIIDRDDYDIAWCAGDINNYKDMPKPFYFTAGNHDRDIFMDLITAIEQGKVELNNFTNIEPGKIYQYNRLNIAGLPGNFAPSDFKKDRGDLNNSRHFTKQEVEDSLKLGKHDIDVFISHEAPKGVADLDWKERKQHYGVQPVRDILDAVEPKFMVTGHIHSLQIAKHNSSIVINSGYGAKGEFVIIDTSDNKVEIYKKKEKCEEIPLSAFDNGEIYY